MPKQRDFYFDNAKFILILLVVLGHCLELVGTGFVPGLYRLLYLFHMPVFAAVTGYFSKRCRAAQLAALALQYFLFETLYLLFANLALGQATPYDYTRPYWILWFLVSSICWKAAAPLAAKLPARLVLPASVAVALAAGYLPFVGRAFSLSRTLVFFPFFLLGHAAERRHFTALRRLPRPLCVLFPAASLLAAMGPQPLSAAFLYAGDPYATFGLAGPWPALLRLLCLAWGFGLGCCFLALVPDRETRYTAMGRRTLALYLIHGFLLRTIGAATPLPRLMDTLPEFGVFLAAMAGVSLLLLTKPVSRVLAALTGPLRALARRRKTVT